MVGGVGLAIAILMLVMPRHLLRWLSRLPGLSPNWVTLWSIPLMWAGVSLYFTGSTRAGFWLTVFALMLDRVDGKMATQGEPFVWTGATPRTPAQRRRRFWRELNHPGSTEVGKWLDPLADKLKIPIPLLYLGWIGLVPWGYPAAIIVFEILGTVMRPPFQLVPAHYQRGTAATAVGKLKVMFQFTTLIVLWADGWSWLVVQPWLYHLLLSLALLFGVMSVLSRLNFTGRWAWLNKAMDRFTRAFSHQKKE